MSATKPLTIAQAIDQVLATTTGPIDQRELIRRVLEIRPSQAKNPAPSVQNVLRWDYIGHELIKRANGQLVRISDVMRGVRFRHVVSRDERRMGVIACLPLFQGYSPLSIAPEQVVLLDATGHPLSAPIVTARLTVDDLFFVPQEVEMPALEVKAWFRRSGMAEGDSVLFTIEDWYARRYRIEREPADRRDEREIQRCNQELADSLFDLLEHAYYESIFIAEAIPTAYDCMTHPHGYPGDHWWVVVSRDPRLSAGFLDIRYADPTSPFDFDLGQESPAAEPFGPVSPEALQRVYRLAVRRASAQRTRLRIEVLGSTPLHELDELLREGLRLDTWDHLSGFWKLVPRGGTNRIHEVELATVGPGGEGYGGYDDMPWAVVGLTPAELVKYVYDFGAWKEFLITQEDVTDPEAGAAYPRVISGGRRPAEPRT